MNGFLEHEYLALEVEEEYGGSHGRVVSMA